MNVEELKQLLHEQNEGVLSTNIPEVINSVMTLYEKGVEVGMKIGGQIKINQACEWLESTDIDMEYWNPEEGVCKELLIEGIKKAMEL